MAELVNRVAQSGLLTIDLEEIVPVPDYATFDLSTCLFQGLVLREKEFRDTLANHDWSQYSGKTLLVYCSTDAIVPSWAQMLVASYAMAHTEKIFSGEPESYLEDYYRNAIGKMDISAYRDQRIVVKGCSSRTVPPGAYLELVKKLQPVVRSLMFGEPCSTVPVYKRKV